VSPSARRVAYVPDRGDAVWLTFEPHAGHEQAGRRPAVVISPRRYNRLSGLALLCPVTSQIKGYPFEVLLPSGLPIEGAVLSDQIRSLDWRARRASRICALPSVTIEEVIGKLQVLISASDQSR
jgi:mRNA interferase MazF